MPTKPTPKPAAKAPAKKAVKATGKGALKKTDTKSPKRTGGRVNGLLPKQAAFIAEYLISGNATQAAIHAGYSPKTAHVIGQENLKKPAIASLLAAKQAEIDAKQSARLEEMGLTEERVARETARLAFFDARKMFDAKGNPIPLNELDDDTAAAIVGLDVLEEWAGSGRDRVLVGHIKKYKIADKNSALERAAKILGMFKKDNEQPGAAAGNAMAQFLNELSARGSRLPTGGTP